LLTRDRPDLSSEKAPNGDKTAKFGQIISGLKFQNGLDTKTY
jgi:hypothetical protein